MNATDRRHMARALDLARRGLYSTGPNPRVGCVIARGGRVVGEGWHRYAGEPHAEIHALAAAGGDSRGATAYVTLEPCRHTGRTGPCTWALIEAGVAKVVAAMPDPDPRVAGRGFAELAEAGIKVETGLMEASARSLNRGFVSRHERGRPWVRCKLAATLDGRTAMATGESRWITGEAARADVHRLRARADAVLTGIDTLLADDPRLDARVEAVRTEDARMEDAWTEDTGCPAPPMQPPMRVIVDSRLRTPPAARALSAPGAVLIATIGGAGAAGGGRTTGDDGAEGPVGGITREPEHTLAATAGADAAERPIVGGIAREPGNTLAATAGADAAEGPIVGGIAGGPGDTLAATAGADATEGPIVGGIAGEPGHTLAAAAGATARMRALIEAGVEIVPLPSVGRPGFAPCPHGHPRRARRQRGPHRMRPDAGWRAARIGPRRRDRRLSRPGAASATRHGACSHCRGSRRCVIGSAWKSPASRGSAPTCASTRSR